MRTARVSESPRGLCYRNDRWRGSFFVILRSTNRYVGEFRSTEDESIFLATMELSSLSFKLWFVHSLGNEEE